jgi:hypothetical protein
MKNAVIFLEPKGTILEVVREAKRRGYTVIALVGDPTIFQTLPRPYDSAVPCIDAIYPVESWNDKEQLCHIVRSLSGKDETVAGVFTGVDPCAVSCAVLRKHFQLPTAEPEVVELVINKYRLRSRLRELELSKIRTFHGSVVDKWNTWEVGGPAYFKPERGLASLYVRRCNSLSDLRQAKRNWETDVHPVPKYMADYIHFQPEYLLEEAFDGELLSVEAISFRGQFHFIGLTSRILYSQNPIVEMGSCFPYPHPLTDQIVSFVRKAHADLGFTDGPTHTEVIVNSEGELEIIDFNPRFIGADVLQSINFAYGIQIESALLDWALGREPIITPTQEFFSCIQYLLPPAQLVFESIEFPHTPELKFHTTFTEVGKEVSGSDRQVDYLGCYLTVLPDYAAALNRSRELRAQVTINNNLLPAY